MSKMYVYIDVTSMLWMYLHVYVHKTVESHVTIQVRRTFVTDGVRVGGIWKN